MDIIRHELIRAYNKGTIKVADISKNVQKRRLTWYGHAIRSYGEYVEKRVMSMDEEKERTIETEVDGLE